MNCYTLLNSQGMPKNRRSFFFLKIMNIFDGNFPFLVKFILPLSQMWLPPFSWLLFIWMSPIYLRHAPSFPNFIWRTISKIAIYSNFYRALFFLTVYVIFAYYDFLEAGKKGFFTLVPKNKSMIMNEIISWKP